MITSKQRAYLRGLANTMQPIFQIGKGGIEEAFFFSAFQMIYGTASYGAVPRSTSI